MNELKKMKDLFDDFIKEADKFIDKQKYLELEDHNFKINSDSWHKITIDSEEYLENQEKDVWVLLDGECRGEQLFTYDSAMRETKKAGKLIPSDEQLSELLKNKEDLSNAVFPGFRNTDGSFNNRGSNLNLWSSTPSGSNAWRRNLNTTYSTVNRNANNKANGFSVRCLRDTDDTSDFTDPRDGTVYPCVKIGNQVWMTKNLAYLPSVNAAADGSETDPKYYVYGYDGTDVATAKALDAYINEGVLYNYPAAIISAPTGFHVPSDEELNVLEVFTLGLQNKAIKLTGAGNASLILNN
jgi:hypothetical protein